MAKAIGLATLLALVGYAINGWVASVLWGWFLVPLGVREIGTWWGAGIIALISLVMPGGKTASQVMNEADEDTLFDTLYSIFGAPALALLSGFIIRLLMGG